MFPIGTDRPQRRTPSMNITLIVINILLFLASHRFAGSSEASMVSVYDNPALNPGWSKYQLNYRSPTSPQPSLYQFVTYQFLHQDFWHLAGNMLFLWVFGNNLNEKLGHVGYLAFYLTGGVLAGCGQVIASDNPTLGASGSISAVTGLFLVMLPRTNIRVFILFIIMTVVEIPSMWFILFSIAKDVFEQYYFPESHVAHLAHLAGTASGFFIGLLLLFTGLVQRDHYDLLALIERWRRRRQYEGMVNRGYDPFGPSSRVKAGEPASGWFRPSPNIEPPPTDPRITELRSEVQRLLREHQVPLAAAKFLELRQLEKGAVFPPQDQLDLANQLMTEGRYPEAAATYEDYLRLYPTAGQSEQVQLILGIIYATYWPNPARASELLRQALPRLHDPAQRRMAEEELAKLNPPGVPPIVAPPK